MNDELLAENLVLKQRIAQLEDITLKQLINHSTESQKLMREIEELKHHLSPVSSVVNYRQREFED